MKCMKVYINLIQCIGQMDTVDIQCNKCMIAFLMHCAAHDTKSHSPQCKLYVIRYGQFCRRSVIHEFFFQTEEKYCSLRHFFCPKIT
ncbi:hypothetical protein GDO81_029345 [Engystomops pustulosus]|uniref:Uncharacterized protein n=1 Tax=Engystomops pustulosus TaxID=76066 RepID=A0AAV6YCT1_ENGPU|nr:hypothetical protein GDO81_029345 [Engystomops pustulosus]